MPRARAICGIVNLCFSVPRRASCRKVFQALLQLLCMLAGGDAVGRGVISVSQDSWEGHRTSKGLERISAHHPLRRFWASGQRMGEVEPPLR